MSHQSGCTPASFRHLPSPKITQKNTFRKSKLEHSTYIQNQIQNKLENHTQKNIIYYEIKINHAAGG